MKKKIRTYFRNAFREYASPVFIAMLLFSVFLWYLTKLSYSYTAEVPVKINLSGNKFRVNCLAEGTGYRLVAHKYFMPNDIKLNFREIQTTPSVINANSYVINPLSLQNAISLRVNDIRIISVETPPEVTVSVVE